uniref:lipopolysaccharide biosynthesis protein n=1 Tax=Algoriphagus sp. TaxID=1872435 RepID=UPI0040471C79
MSVDSLRKRYLFKLSSSLLGFAISIIIQAIVPRGLGPEAFGSYAFLTSILTQIVLFFDLGNTSAFFVKVSQRPREFKIVTFYLGFTMLGFGLFLTGIATISFFPTQTSQIFPGQEIFYILIAAFFAIFSRVLQILNNMVDAYGLTVQSEKGMMGQKVVGLIIIFLLYITDKLNLINYFLYQYFIILLLSLLFIWIIRDSGIFKSENWKLTWLNVKEYFQEFYTYSNPLLIGFLFGFVSGILDRWLLQYFGGSVEQGFYGISFQISAVSTLFTGAMSMLIMREFSIAFSKSDFKHMAYLFRRFIPLLYSISAYISCFVAVQSDKVIYLMGGSQFKNAYLAVFIMSFYPIHQTYGQLSGSVFLATGQTKLYARLGILSVILGLPMVFFLLASSKFFGFNLGATGLAIKMVLIQVIFVNIQLYYNSRLLNLNFWKYIGHQIVCVTCLLVISIVVMLLINYGLNFENQVIVNFFLSGMVYTGLVIILVYFQPIVFGINSHDISYIKNLIIQRIK